MLKESRSCLGRGWLAIRLGRIGKRSSARALVLALASSAIATSLLVVEASTCSPLLTVRLVLWASVLSLPILRWHVGNRTWNILRALVDIEILINRWWYWLNLCPKLLFDLVQAEPIIPIDQVDC